MAEEATLRAAFRKHGQEADDGAAPLTPTYQDLVSVRKALTAIEAQDKTQSSSAHASFFILRCSHSRRSAMICHLAS